MVITTASYGADKIRIKDDSVDAKIEDMFVVADLDADGLLTQTEYVDYQVAEARSRFVTMAGDDSFVSLEEVKVWYLAKKAENNKAPAGDGASE